MLYKEYGKTGKAVSIIGFGGMRFAEPKNIEESAGTVLHAFSKGVNYFDTAPGYTKDKSETIMGEAVKEMWKSGTPFYLSSKSAKSSGKELRTELEKSLRRLNTDRIDFYHCWCVMTLDDWEGRKKGGAVKELQKAKEEGLINHVCLSTHLSGPDIRRVAEEGIFEGITLGYSAVNFPYREEGIRSAGEKNLGVVIMNPLGGGLIPENPDTFSFIKTRENQSMVDAALHFLFSQRAITCAIVGFRNKADIDSAAAAVDSFVPYSEKEIALLKGRIEADFNNLCTTCMYCQGCPVDIPVWKFMETANHLILSRGERIFERLKYHWGGNIDDLSRCTQCRLCEEKCTQKLPILDRFEELKTAIAKSRG